MTAKAHLTLDRYVIEPLMRDLVGHDRKPSAYLVYLAVAGQNDAGVRAMSYQELAEFTGLSRRSVQDAVAHLARRKLLEVQRVGPTETAVYRALTPWRR
jgi:DNA-binding FadR family transcriptional regulator